MVTGVTYRNPALLAKTVTTLDIISQGRAILGIGAAWNDDEHEGYGFDFPPLKERFDRLEDACRSAGRCSAGVADLRRPPLPHRRRAQLAAADAPRRPADPDRRQRREEHDPAGRPLRRRLQLLRRRRDDPAQAPLLEPLRQVGRDPADITKTRLGAVVIGDTQPRPTQGQGDPPASTLSTYAGRTSWATPTAWPSRLRRFLDAGLDGMMISLPDAHDLEPVELAGHTLAARLGSVSAV